MHCPHPPPKAAPKQWDVPNSGVGLVCLLPTAPSAWGPAIYLGKALGASSRAWLSQGTFDIGILCPCSAGSSQELAGDPLVCLKSLSVKNWTDDTPTLESYKMLINNSLAEAEIH